MTIIKGGEKTFTDKARAKVLREYRSAIHKLAQEIYRLGNDADCIAAAKTLADLERVRRRQHSDDPGDLREYTLDNRKVCAHCGTKQRGGVHGFILSRPRDYYCWKDACRKAFNKASAKDEKEHPKLYAAAEKRARAQRRQGEINSRRNRRRKRK